ncbi:MAG: rRNA pseudouridine synthase, partial [Gemmatimonadetes bacterium]|nr:rRNA pseudouridine synthase [Gemmatimonadota bacterium]
MTIMRLQRALARGGVASRRAAEELIRDGKVRVNGQVAHLGMSADPDHDVITVQGKRVTQAETVWIALHKPVEYVVTRSDPEGRPTVFTLVPDVPGLTYVGRLDVMTSGLLLLTTDGEAAHRLMHPRYQVERTYRVVVHGRSEVDIRSAFRRGIVIEGRAVNVVDLKIRPAQEGRGTGSLELLMVLAEGRYRIVRRICEQLRLKVEWLVRLSYGPIRLGPLEPGAWRYLTRGEIVAVSGGSAGR